MNILNILFEKHYQTIAIEVLEDASIRSLTFPYGNFNRSIQYFVHSSAKIDGIWGYVTLSSTVWFFASDLSDIWTYQNLTYSNIYTCIHTIHMKLNRLTCSCVYVRSLRFTHAIHSQRQWLCVIEYSNASIGVLTFFVAKKKRSSATTTTNKYTLLFGTSEMRHKSFDLTFIY